MTLAQSRTLPEFTPLERPVDFRKPGTALVARIDPDRLPFHGLTRDQVVVLHLIADQSDRPVFFSTTDGAYPFELGVGDHLLTEGFARKVVATAPTTTRDTIDTPGDGWIDTSRSLSLWDELTGPRTLLEHPGWVDRSSANMPLMYALRGSVLADALARRGQPGDTAQARRVMTLGLRIADDVGMGDLFRPRRPTGAPLRDTAPATEVR
jgi:hypothetical protein